MVTVGFDLDKVASLSRFNWMQSVSDRLSENFFWWLQRFRLLQQVYNFCFRKPNPEIKGLMSQLKYKGFKVVIISASNESYRQELERWLKKTRFCL